MISFNIIVSMDEDLHFDNENEPVSDGTAQIRSILSEHARNDKPWSDAKKSQISCSYGSSPCKNER